MLLLRNERRDWSAAEAARALRIQPESVQNRMETLSRAGVLADEGGGRYRFGPRTPELGRDVDAVAATYAERRVTVINLIATKHLERIKSFADAFKFKGGEK